MVYLVCFYNPVFSQVELVFKKSGFSPICISVIAKALYPQLTNYSTIDHSSHRLFSMTNSQKVQITTTQLYIHRQQAKNNEKQSLFIYLFYNIAQQVSQPFIPLSFRVIKCDNEDGRGFSHLFLSLLGGVYLDVFYLHRCLGSGDILCNRSFGTYVQSNHPKHRKHRIQIQRFHM